MDKPQNKYSGIILILQLAIIADFLFLSKQLLWTDFVIFLEWLQTIIVKLKGWQTLISSILGVAIACLTFWFSLKRFHHEKWWLMKVEAYQRIIEALHHSKQYYSAYLDREMRIRKITEAQQKELSTLIKKAEDEISKAIDLGTFFISKESLKLLKNYKEETDKKYDHLFDLFDSNAFVASNCLDALIILAKKDLGKRI